MHKWFECVIKYDKTSEEGKIERVTEHYLVDALSHAEAENRIIEEMKPFITGEFEVNKVSNKKINELFENEDGDKWYRCKVNFVTLDEDKGVEKRTAITMLAQAGTLKESLEVLEAGMKGTTADYEIASITETSIMDVFKYKTDE